ncbi:hydrogenase [Metallibacterium scheffleri]|uniref:Hydrogenase n=1 Tax=Metallibacterium scheffleri TaxID=993689 RepID=A0A4S3KGZ0_9GAMM|nr:hydrogenase [Metallibacterium scheffleri]THD07913.1 hydrogenase [Metallibacterium scheffleri]
MVALHLSPLLASIFSLIAIGALVLSFVMLGSRWLKDYMLAFAVQSWLIAILSALMAWAGGYTELYFVAALTALFRGLVLPLMLLWVLKRLHVNRELHEIVQPSTALVLGAVLVIFGVVVAYRIGHALDIETRVVLLALTVMLSIKLIGFLMLAIRREAVSSILGILMLENGIFLGSQILVPGMPLMIELVLLFDLLVAVTCFAVLVRYLMASVGATGSQALQKLVG